MRFDRRWDVAAASIALRFVQQRARFDQHDIGGQRRQHLLQHLYRRRARVADGDGGAVAPRQFDRAVELAADVGFVRGIVEKHLAFDHFHAGAGRGAGRLAAADGHAVEEVQAVAFERLHHFLHARQAGGHGAAHVVVHADRVGHVVHRIADDALDLVAAHGGLQGIALQRLLAERRHRHVDQDFAALAVGAGGHQAGMRRVGQHRDRDRRRHLQHRVFFVRAVAHVIDDDGEFSCLRSVNLQQTAY